MKVDFIQQPFEIDLKNPMDICPRGLHSVSFYELVYIVSGTGVQIINDHHFHYKKGDLFLLAPNDSHNFLFDSTTQLLFIRFNRVFLQFNPRTSDFWKRIEQLLLQVNSSAGRIVITDADDPIVQNMLHALVAEVSDRRDYSTDVTIPLVQSILGFVARAQMKETDDAVFEIRDNKAADIIQYIHEHICHPQEITAARLATVFGISGNYLGRYFKSQTRQTLNEYVTQYRLKLVENLLRYSDMRMREIADELGFTDHSHLNKFFQKYKNVTPTKFRHHLRQKSPQPS
jgi:AraC-like DNA-binding protein